MMIQTSLTRQVTDSAVEVNASYARLHTMGALELGCAIRIVRLRGTSYTGKFTGEIEITVTSPDAITVDPGTAVDRVPAGVKSSRTLRLYNVAAGTIPASVRNAWVGIGCPADIAVYVLTGALAHSRATEVNALVALI